jgi:ribosomal protein S18 acetylase RimI-like enzyme
MDIRPATTADRDAVLALLRAQFDEHAIATDGLGPAVDGVLIDGARGRFLLALEDGRAVGLAAVLYLWTLEHGGPAAWLDELYVVPSRRNAGVGRRLLDAALTTARAHGALAVDLEVDVEHERASHLYERAGFRRHRRTRWFLPLR